MSIESLKSSLPDYAKDLKLNLGSLMNEQLLSDQQKYGCFLACAHAVGEPQTLTALKAEAEEKLSPEAIKAAKAASAIMGMNNVYYRSIHLISAPTYKTLPAKLRMNVIGAPGIEKADFELYSLGVSAVNGCGMCLDAHEAELRKHGLSAEQVQAGFRIGAVVNAVARVLAAEAVTATAPA
ncbi:MULTISPECIES: carboxymuconolactone decarboxylase family protein [Hyphomonas]|jgi:alkyl hydroperoxide reductase subunit D|uniref:carboxymuconolactone decarboxylase family protein n=1 Tax=Hyphomonas TaxID=85 RepID=UPI00351857D6